MYFLMLRKWVLLSQYTQLTGSLTFWRVWLSIDKCHFLLNVCMKGLFVSFFFRINDTCFDILYLIQWVTVDICYSTNHCQITAYCKTSVCYCTFKILLQEIWVGHIWNGAVGTRVTRIAAAVSTVNTHTMAVTHVLALRADVNIVQGPCGRSRAAWIKPLIPAEPHGAESTETPSHTQHTTGTRKNTQAALADPHNRSLPKWIISLLQPCVVPG